MKILFILNLMTLLFAGSAPWSIASPQPQLLPIGVWGGEHAQLNVQADGLSFTFDCAQASIAYRPRLDPRGAFQAQGSYTFLHPGPIRPDERPDRHPAIFRGRMRSDKLWIHISVQRGARLVHFRFGPLQLGSSGHLIRCL